MIIDRYLNPMYPIALEVRKTLFKTYVFRESAWGRDVMAYYYPYRPNTPDQVAWSNHFAQAVFDWQGFDESTKSYYNKMRYPTHMSGYNRYISYYLRQIDLMPTYWGALEKSSEDATLIQTLLDLKANIADVFIGKIKVGTESIGATDTSKVITFSEEFAAKYTVRPGGNKYTRAVANSYCRG